MEHTPPCDQLKVCSEDTEKRMSGLEAQISDLKSNVDDMKSDLKAMREIIETWNNTKGFVTTIQVLSKIAMWFAGLTAAIVGAYHAIKHWS